MYMRVVDIITVSGFNYMYVTMHEYLTDNRFCSGFFRYHKIVRRLRSFVPLY